ncbi:tRNA uridine-5-carboxymethylaminomethyl(34) synthesis GTPase MnmE [Allosediminivita pacifica]|uniref:tRNA modification GTPase MnmE n=1 Tax=Allosediminivita pacifica TaxID=1267769 RepID=A0A2T6B5S8_9RHOB|nr:tRNA uridine-5-carboxymethylaminomethyl(34) synthesis GTPase MnmE [Allosediminivita pacifica]PTX51405.1 tRNA modification GTPase trmE [Allosediminivita pacifica]GGA99579.1 tRNA modification GTPase MnmE [Allosediminivita pacifica]
MSDTIFALASAPGRAGVSVIRVSGPQAFEVARLICGDLPQARCATLRRLSDATGQFLDEALVLVFEPGRSFTGEAVVEFQVHGSAAVIGAVLRTLSEIEGCRQAEPGEFTRRALENERMDLTQVEALADLIDAETESQRRQALRVLSGALGDLVGQWRKDVIRAGALIEATIDFADEEVPTDVTPEVSALLDSVLAGLSRELSGLSAAERVRTGFEVAIVGPPNAGKSTLLNYLAGREAAITSDIAGTTRDVIEVRMEIAGLAVTLLDTAGLRETSDAVETLGVDLARRRALAADLRIHLLPAGTNPLIEVTDGDILVAAKADSMVGGSGVSGLTGRGVPELLENIGARLCDRTADAGLAARERHRVVLGEGKAHLLAARDLLNQGAEMYDLAAEELRAGARVLSSLLGHVDVEDLLDEIFSSFCVGK